MPPSGYGPVNYGNQDQSSPFSSFDNRINYNDMVRHQMVSQYNQGVLPPSAMPLNQQRMIATDPRFQYGVQGGMDQRFYERQAQLSRTAYGTNLMSGLGGLASFGLMEAAMTGTGIGMFSMAGLGIMGAAAVPGYFLNKGIQHSLERRKFMASIATDVEQYRDRLGFSGGLSYQQATQLGAGLQESMYRPGGFFSKEQQMRMHKIGLSNDLLSARGPGGMKGDIQQYQKNFEELKSTTEDIVKLLQTTMEGGMSVINELKKTGFGSLRQIKQQVHMAKAIGGMTGIGAQNVMQLGSAGAQAVQGTPWSASVGAAMYQMGAAQAQAVSSSGAAGEYAVRRVGGIAAAGAAIGNFGMNVLQSGIGSRMIAYAMKGDGSIDQARLDRALSGKAGAYEIVTGANNAGYAMGENRVRFGMFKEDAYNQMSQVQRMQMIQGAFNAWSGQRPYSSLENKAWVYAGMYTNNQREQRLMYEQLRNPLSMDELNKRGTLERAMINQRMGSSIGIARDLRRVAGGFGNVLDQFGEGVTSISSDVMNFTSEIAPAALTGLGRGAEYLASAVGITGPGGFINRANYGDARNAYETVLGLRKMSNVEMAASARYKSRGGVVGRVRARSPIQMSVNDLIGTWVKSGNLQHNVQSLIKAVGNNKYDQLLEDPYFKEGMSSRNIAEITKNPQQSAQWLLNQIGNAQESVNSKFERAVGIVETREKLKGKDNAVNREERFARLKAKQLIDQGTRLVLDSKLDSKTIEKRPAESFLSGILNRNESYSFGVKNLSEESREWIRSYQGKKSFEEIDMESLRAAEDKSKIALVDMRRAIGVRKKAGVLARAFGIDPRTGSEKARVRAVKGLGINLDEEGGDIELGRLAFQLQSGGDGSDLPKNAAMAETIIKRGWGKEGVGKLAASYESWAASQAELIGVTKADYLKNPSTSKQDKYSMLREDAEKLRRFVADVGGNIKLNDGTEFKRKWYSSDKEAKYEAKKELEKIESQLSSFDEDKTMSSTVRSPTLNYWNNRWVL